MSVNRHLQSGDQLPTSAATWNDIFRAVRSGRDRERNFAAETVRQATEPSVVMAANTSGTQLDAHVPVGISTTPLIDAHGTGSHLAGILRKPMLRLAPTSATYYGRWGISLQPLAPNEIGRVVVAGLALAKVRYPVSANFVFAELDAETFNSGRLVAQGYGPAQIVARDTTDTGSGVYWCIIRIGNRTNSNVFNVNVTVDGGDAGSDSTSCTFTYTVKTLQGATIATGLSPDQRNGATYSNVEYVPPVEGTSALAYYDQNNVLRLAYVPEIPVGAVCEKE